MRITFDTLQLYDGRGIQKVKIPHGHGDTGDTLEPFTTAYTEFGVGGERQLLPTDRVQVTKADSIYILPRE